MFMCELARFSGLTKFSTFSYFVMSKMFRVFYQLLQRSLFVVSCLCVCVCYRPSFIYFYASLDSLHGKREIRVFFSKCRNFDGKISWYSNGFTECVSWQTKLTQSWFWSFECLSVQHFDELEISSFIIDCEVVAFDVKTQKILPFQTLSTRKRKVCWFYSGVVSVLMCFDTKDVKAEDISVQVCLYAFDCLYLNGKVMLIVERARGSYKHDTHLVGTKHRVRGGVGIFAVKNRMKTKTEHRK